MSKPSALQTMIELAQTRANDAARRLGTLNGQGADIEKQLQVLMQYREEYCARFRTSVVAGIDAMGWRNYQEFLAKLDVAIAQQQEALAHAQRHIQAGRETWQSARRTLKAYDTLAQRQTRAELLRVAKLEQKETDEHAVKAKLRDYGR